MNQLWLVFAVLASELHSQKPFQIQFMGQVSGKNVTICLDGRKVKHTFAGKLAMRDANHQFASVCADVRTPVVSGQYFNVRQQKATASKNQNLARAGRIVAQYFFDARSAEECAGLQLAVWEALEDGNETPNFAQGRFQARTDNATLLYAVQYYQAIETSKSPVLLESITGSEQSQLTVPTVVPSKGSDTRDD